MKKALFLPMICGLLLAGSAWGVTVPYTEDFDLNNANWVSNASATFLTHSAAGGPDGGAYASATFNFQSSTAGSSTVLKRANPTTTMGPASGGNFIGNWITSGVKEFRAQVRHNAPEPVSYFARFADTAGFPGAIAVKIAPVLPNIWTEMFFSIHPGSPNFVSFEGFSFADVFDNIGRVQIGISVPAALAGVNQVYTFDVDKVSIVNTPEPSSLVMGGLALVALLSRRQIRSL